MLTKEIIETNKILTGNAFDKIALLVPGYDPQKALNLENQLIFYKQHFPDRVPESCDEEIIALLKLASLYADKTISKKEFISDMQLIGFNLDKINEIGELLTDKKSENRPVYYSLIHAEEKESLDLSQPHLIRCFIAGYSDDEFDEFKQLSQNKKSLEDAGVITAEQLKTYINDHDNKCPPNFQWRPFSVIKNGLHTTTYQEGAIGFIVDASATTTLVPYWYKKNAESLNTSSGKFEYEPEKTGLKNRRSKADLVEKLTEMVDRRIGKKPDNNLSYYGLTALNHNEILVSYQKEGVQAIVVPDDRESAVQALFLRSQFVNPLPKFYRHTVKDGLIEVSIAEILTQAAGPSHDDNITIPEVYDRVDDKAHKPPPFKFDAIKSSITSLNKPPRQFKFYHPIHNDIECIAWVDEKTSNPVIDYYKEGKAIRREICNGTKVADIAGLFYEQEVKKLNQYLAENNVEILNKTPFDSLVFSLTKIGRRKRQLQMTISYRGNDSDYQQSIEKLLSALKLPEKTKVGKDEKNQILITIPSVLDIPNYISYFKTVLDAPSVFLPPGFNIELEDSDKEDLPHQNDTPLSPTFDAEEFELDDSLGESLAKPAIQPIQQPMFSTSPQIPETIVKPLFIILQSTGEKLTEENASLQATTIVEELSGMVKNLKGQNNNLAELQRIQSKALQLSNTLYDINQAIQNNKQILPSKKTWMDEQYNTGLDVVAELSKQVRLKGQEPTHSESTTPPVIVNVLNKSSLIQQQKEHRKPQLNKITGFLKILTEKKEKLPCNEPAYTKMDELIKSIKQSGSTYENDGDFDRYRKDVKKTIENAKNDSTLNKHRGWGEMLAILRSITMAVITLGYSMKKCRRETGHAFFRPGKTDSIKQIENAEAKFDEDISKSSGP